MTPCHISVRTLWFRSLHLAILDLKPCVKRDSYVYTKFISFNFWVANYNMSHTSRSDDECNILCSCSAAPLYPQFASTSITFLFVIHVELQIVGEFLEYCLFNIIFIWQNHQHLLYCDVHQLKREWVVNITIADYGTHRDCLQRVEQNIDCNVAYPQSLPILSYTATTGAWYPQVSSSHNVADGADLIKWGLSTHL